MALEKGFEDNYGVEHSSGYHRILSVDINYQSSIANIFVGMYHNNDARNNDKAALAIDRHIITTRSEPAFDEIYGNQNLDSQNKNPRSVSYDYLKTLPEYSDAKDV